MIELNILKQTSINEHIIIQISVNWDNENWCPLDYRNSFRVLSIANFLRSVVVAIELRRLFITVADKSE